MAFWIRISTNLKVSEIHALRWEHVTDSPDGWTVEGPIGKHGDIVKTVIPVRAVEQLRSFRRESGQVVNELDSKREQFKTPKHWTFGLLCLQRHANLPDWDAYREYLQAAPVARITRRSPVRIIKTEIPIAPMPDDPIKAKPAKKDAGKQYGTIAEVAELLCHCSRTVKNQIKAGNLKGYRVGCKILVEMASVRDFLAQREMRILLQS